MSLYKRGNIYWTRFGINGEIFRKSLETSDPEKAKREERKLLLEADRGQLRPKKESFGSLPFHRDDPDPERSGALEVYLREHSPRLAPRTAQNETYYAKHLAAFFGETRVSNITESKISAYISDRHSKGIANATINKELLILIGVLRRAKRWHLFQGAIKPLKVRKSPVGRALELDEKLWLLRASQMKRGWWRARLAMTLALNTTMRAGEIKSLQWQDIDWLERTLYIRRGKTEESVREIWLNDEAWSAMAHLREEAKKLFGDNLAPHWHVFFFWPINGDPDPTRPAASWRTAWRNMIRSIACPECGAFQNPGERCVNEKCKADIRQVRSPIAGLRFHDLRHQAITELAEGGNSDETVMSIAGHIDRRMMSHYSHIRKQARRAALENLGKDTAASNGTIAAQLHQNRCNSARLPTLQVIEKYGRPVRARTADLHRVKVAL